MWLVLNAPHIACRSCEECLEWWWDEKTRKIVKAGGKDLKRPFGVMPPCRDRNNADGCPNGTPEAQRRLSFENAEAYWHWQQCRAVGKFPEDPIVERNAGIIQQEYDRFDREQNERLALLMTIQRNV